MLSNGQNGTTQLRWQQNPTSPALLQSSSIGHLIVMLYRAGSNGLAERALNTANVEYRALEAGRKGNGAQILLVFINLQVDPP